MKSPTEATKQQIVFQAKKKSVCYICTYVWQQRKTEKTLHAERGRELWATANIYLYKNFSPHCFRETKLDQPQLGFQTVFHSSYSSSVLLQTEARCAYRRVCLAFTCSLESKKKLPGCVSGLTWSHQDQRSVADQRDNSPHRDRSQLQDSPRELVEILNIRTRDWQMGVQIQITQCYIH